MRILLQLKKSNIDVSMYYTFAVIIVNSYMAKGPFRGMNCHLDKRKYNYLIEIYGMG